MNVLIYGAGVIGSIFGAKLAMAGHDVTMLARGRRLQELREAGLVLQSYDNGEEEIVSVKTIEELAPDMVYDYILVVMQRTQVGEVIDILAQNASQNIVLVVNNAAGYEDWIKRIRMDRLMFGFPSAGGERIRGKVRYFVGKGFVRLLQTTTFGEASGLKTERVSQLIRAFTHAGIPSDYCADMDAWQKTHVVMVSSIANALYGHDCNNRRLARQYEDIRTMILAIKEGFLVLRKLGVCPTPYRMKFFDLPTGVLAGIFKIVMGTSLAEIAMAKHCAAATSEMVLLQQQFDELIAKSKVATPSIDKLRNNLHQYANQISR